MRKGWGGLLSRGRYGDFRAAMLQFEYFMRGASPFAFILLLDRRSTLSQKAVCALTAFWPVIRAYGSGTRSALIVAVLPLLAVIYYRCTPHWQKLLIYLRHRVDAVCIFSDGGHRGLAQFRPVGFGQGEQRYVRRQRNAAGAGLHHR